MLAYWGTLNRIINVIGYPRAFPTVTSQYVCRGKKEIGKTEIGSDKGLLLQLKSVLLEKNCNRRQLLVEKMSQIAHLEAISLDLHIYACIKQVEFIKSDMHRCTVNTKMNNGSIFRFQRET